MAEVASQDLDSDLFDRTDTEILEIKFDSDASKNPLDEWREIESRFLGHEENVKRNEKHY